MSDLESYDDYVLDKIDIKASIRDDLATMEHPFFALKAGMVQKEVYNHNGVSIEIKSTADGMATVFDKDLWIYMISKINKAYNIDGTLSKINRDVTFSARDYFKVTGRALCGQSYVLLEKSLKRLMGTVITTNYNFNGCQDIVEFGLVDSWSMHTDNSNKLNKTYVSVSLPKWLISSLEENNCLLSINPNYFKIKKAIHRRIYELARKHCGNKNSFKIDFKLLLKKTGSTIKPKHFMSELKVLEKSSYLPDFNLRLENDLVIFEKNNKDSELYTNDSESDCKTNKGSVKKVDYTQTGNDFSHIPKGFRGE